MPVDRPGNPARYFLCLGQTVFCQIPVQPGGKALVHLKTADISVGVQVVRLAFDDTDGDVGAVVGDALEVGQQVIENKAQLNGALSRLEPVDVAHLDLLNELVDGLLQRLHLPGGHGVVGGKAVEGQGHDVVQGGEENLS